MGLISVIMLVPKMRPWVTASFTAAAMGFLFLFAFLITGKIGSAEAATPRPTDLVISAEKNYYAAHHSLTPLVETDLTEMNPALRKVFLTEIEVTRVEQSSDGQMLVIHVRGLKARTTAILRFRVENGSVHVSRGYSFQ